MKNITTPRTLSECSWTTGYPAVQHEHHSREGMVERIAGVLLATVIGVLLSAFLLHFWMKGW